MTTANQSPTATPGRPFRILHVMDSLGEGGAEQNLLTLVRRLPPPRCEHQVAHLYDDLRMIEQFRPHVTRLIDLRATRGVGLLAAARRLAEHLRRDRPDVIHAKLIRAQLVVRIAARLAGGVPVVTTWECVSYNERMYLELGWRRPILREVTRALDAATGIADRHFIAVSEQVADYNAKKLGVRRDRVTVVYNAIEPDRIVHLDAAERARVRADLGVPEGAPFLLSVGRLVDQKAHDVAIDAMEEVVRRRPDAVLLIAGIGQLESELRDRICRRGLEGRVRLLGARRDVPQLLQAADVFVFASHYEGLGIALMEALAAGLPAVASRIATSLEVAEGVDAIRYFQPGDPHDMARAVFEVLADREGLAAAARGTAAQVSERFSPERMVSEFMAVASRAASQAP